MKKISVFVLIFIVFLIALVTEYFCVIKKVHYINEEKTLTYQNAKTIAFDENYAKDVAIIVYKQFYNKEFSYDDFIVEDLEREAVYHNVYLNPQLYRKFLNLNDGDLEVYDGHNGLLIDKDNGAIVINFGERITPKEISKL